MLNFYHIIVFALVFLVSLALTRIIIAVCHRFSVYDYPGKHKRHRRPTPILGGTVILLGTWLGLAVYLGFTDDSLLEVAGIFPNILAGSLIIYLIGLVDDFRPINAWLKLAAQTAAGLVLYFGGLSIDLLSVPVLGTTGLNGFSVLITVFWVVALSNAINLIDGLDGLATGVSAIASATMVILGVLFRIDAVIVVSLCLLGSLSAFWIFNRYPARIFLGDGGSLLIGYFFAVLSLIVPIKSFTTAALFMPLVILGVPLTETLSSFLRRLLAGKNVMKADRRHIFHYLQHLGLTHGQIVNLFYLSGLFFSLTSVGMFFYRRTLVMTILVLFMVVIFISVSYTHLTLPTN